MRSLTRLLKELHDEVSAERSPARAAKRGASGKNLLAAGGVSSKNLLKQGSSSKSLGKKSPTAARPPPPASLQRI